MELSMPTIVIKDLYDNPSSEFKLTLTEVSWYGTYKCDILLFTNNFIKVITHQKKIKIIFD